MANKTMHHVVIGENTYEIVDQYAREHGGVTIDPTLTQTGQAADAAAVGAALENVTVDVDATLTQTGQAADAKKVGDEIGEVKNALEFTDEFVMTDLCPASTDWESGGINSTDGVSPLTASSRIRTKGYLPDHVAYLRTINQYEFALFAYDAYGTYLGVYNNGSFAKTLNFVQEADLRDVDHTYTYRVVLRRYYTTQDIDVSECENLNCYALYEDINAESISNLSKINGKRILTGCFAESGGINLGNGVDVELSTRIRTKYIAVNAGTYITCDPGYKIGVCEYISYGGDLYTFVDTSTSFVKEYTVKNNAFIRVSMAFNSEATIEVSALSHLHIYVDDTPLWSDLYVRKVPRFEQGGLLNSDNTETPANNQNYMIRLRTAPIYVKAGSWVEPYSGFAILIREQKTNANGSEIYNTDDYANWYYTRIIVKHDCYLRIVARKSNGAEITPSEISVKHYLLGPKEHPLLQYATINKGYNSVGSHESTIFFGKTASDVYSLWDAFVDGVYCTKDTIGLDSSGQYNLAAYHFVPKTVESGSKPLNGSGVRNDNILRIMLIAGLHGGEKPAVLALYNLMYNVINHWQENEVLKFLRWNVNLYIIPLLCPYSFDNLDATHGRVNYNHVNINRNFSCRYWERGSSDATSFDYRGAYAGSERETQTVVFLAKSVTPDAIFDIHTYGDGSAYNKMFAWDNSGDGLPQGFTAEIGAQVIKETTLNGIVNHGLPDNNNYISVINQDEKIAFVSQWATENGIYSATPEVTYKLYGDTATGDEAQTLDVRKLNEEFIANAVYFTAMAKYAGRAPMNRAE